MASIVVFAVSLVAVALFLGVRTLERVQGIRIVPHGLVSVCDRGIVAMWKGCRRYAHEATLLCGRLTEQYIVKNLRKVFRRLFLVGYSLYQRTKEAVKGRRELSSRSSTSFFLKHIAESRTKMPR